jgi:hypothetical protein
MSELVVEVRARGFQTRKVERLRVEVARKLTQDFQLEVGDVAQEVTVTTTPGDLIERATISVGHVIDREEVQTLPLNGRYFLDLGLLVPGSVTPDSKRVSRHGCNWVSGKTWSTFPSTSSSAGFRKKSTS